MKKKHQFRREKENIKEIFFVEMLCGKCLIVLKKKSKNEGKIGRNVITFQLQPKVCPNSPLCCC
jgi:hypothetical protein